MTDPKDDLVDLLEANITAASLVDNNSDQARFVVTMARPPLVLLKDWILKQKFDLVYTVAKARAIALRHTQNVPKNYQGDFIIGVWTINKKARVTGEKLRWLAVEDLRTLFRNNPSNQRIGFEEDNDQLISDVQVYNTNLTIVHDDYV